MISEETHNNFREIMDSIYVDLQVMESGNITLENQIKLKLEESLKNYQKQMDQNVNYILEKSEDNSALVLEALSKYIRKQKKESH